MTSFTSLADEAFTSLFTSFERSAFRLETLQKYGVDYEEVPFRDFLEGKPRYTSDDQRQWAEMVANNLVAGKVMRRVHVIEEPLSEYVKYEIAWPYQDSLAAGEDVRVIPVEQGAWPLDLPRVDYWLFDLQVAVVMHYGPDTRFLYGERVADPDTVASYVRAAEIALANSVSLSEYTATRSSHTK